MFYDEEDLLEAVDILMEDYGYDEDEAIDILVESFDEYEDEELENMLEAVDFLMEEYDLTENEALDALSEGFIKNFVKKKTNQAIENGKEVARQKAEEAIERKKQEFKTGINNRKQALVDTATSGMNYNKSKRELKKLDPNSTEYANKSKERDLNKMKYMNSKEKVSGYYNKDKPILKGAAVVGATMLAHRALKKRRLKKQVRKILAKERKRGNL